MASPTRSQAPQTTTQHRPPQAASALDQAIDATNAKLRRLKKDLESDVRIAAIEEVLPDAMKGQAARLAKRALMTMARRPELQDCPDADFIRCVTEAAEIGLAIDGKLAYVVRYKSAWQMQPDYKGIIAVARRTGTIKDCFGDVVCAGDHFEAFRQDGRDHLTHKYDLGVKRGDVIGAWAIVKLPDGDWRYEVMSRTELDEVQKIAPSKNGPWSTWPNEMRKKTVIRRALKNYCDDPAVVRATELADQEFERQAPAKPTNGTPAPPALAAGEVPPDEMAEQDMQEFLARIDEQTEQADDRDKRSGIAADLLRNRVWIGEDNYQAKTRALANRADAGQ